MDILKKIGIALLSVICLICGGLDIWYGVILFTGEDKIISQSFIVSDQTVSRVEQGENVTESRQFCEVNIFDDVYEIKFNFLLDENKEYFYSQGFQFIANENGIIDFENKTFETNVKEVEISSSSRFNFTEGYVKEVTLNRLLKDVSYTNLKVQKYAKDGVTGTSYTTCNPITEEFSFKIEIGDKIYEMKFKNDDITFDQNSNLYLGTLKETPSSLLVYNKIQTINEYRTADVYFFAEEIYKAIVNSEIKPGQTGSFYIQFPDIFEYYEYDGKQYSEVSVDFNNATKITEDISSYFGIKYTYNEGEMKNASQSLFGMKDGNSNFILDGSIATDYFTGTTLINVTANDFEWIATENNGEYLFTLSEDFKKVYADDNSKKLMLYVVIDLDYLSDCGIRFAGFAENAFDGFNVYKAVKESSGEMTEVQYA